MASKFEEIFGGNGLESPRAFVKGRSDAVGPRETGLARLVEGMYADSDKAVHAVMSKELNRVVDIELDRSRKIIAAIELDSPGYLNHVQSWVALELDKREFADDEISSLETIQALTEALAVAHYEAPEAEWSDLLDDILEKMSASKVELNGQAPDTKTLRKLARIAEEAAFEEELQLLEAEAQQSADGPLVRA
jgi:hypothetical protein